MRDIQIACHLALQAPQCISLDALRVLSAGLLKKVKFTCKVYGGVEIKLNAFLISALKFTLWMFNPRVPRGSSAALDVIANREISAPPGKRTLVVQTAASDLTD